MESVGNRMPRIVQYALILLAIVLSIAGVISDAHVAGAAPRPIDLPPNGPVQHPIVNPTLHPTLPIDVNATPTPDAGGGFGRPTAPGGGAMNVVTGWHVDKSLPLPQHVPKLSQFLMKTGKNSFRVRPSMSVGMARLLGSQVVSGNGHTLQRMSLSSNRVRPMSADGSTIILTGDQTNFFENDITISYGTELYVLCENMATTHSIRYVLYPANGSGPVTSNTVSVGNSGNGNNSCTALGQFNLSTPISAFGGSTVGADPAYAGVWVLATYDTTTAQLTSETVVVADSSINFSTYADVAETTQTNDFNPGSTIAVGVTGLNPNHYYAVGWVYTGGGGQPCEYSVPSVGTGKTGVCFAGAVTGVQAFSSTIEEWWNSSSTPSTSTAPTGNYDVELYDATTSEMIGHQQISVEPSSVSWTLTPYSSSGATPPPGLSYNNVFATDGLTDQSVTGLTYAASGLPSSSNGHTIRLTVSDPNGVVLTNPDNTLGWPYMTTNPTVAQASGAISKQVAFPLDATEQMAYGPTQNPFAPNYFVAQLFDTSTSAVIASKSFQVLAYAASFVWAGGATIINAATGTGVTESVTITNTGNQNYGTWNGDGINGIEIQPRTNDQLNGVGAATAIDSAGHTWNLFTTGSGTNEKVWAEPATVGQSLPVGGTLTFSIIIQTATGGTCASTPCYFDTDIRPVHGIAYSGASSVSNALGVVANGTPPSSVTATAAWAVQSEASTANMAARVSYFNHLTYILGTANAPSTDTYNVQLTVNNASNPDGNNLMDLKIVMPSVLDVNANPPTIVSSPAGTGSWSVVTNSAYATLGGANVFELVCSHSAKNGCGLSMGTSGSWVLKFPLFSGSFTEQQTAMTANFDGGSGGGGCSNCNATSYALSPTNTTVNGIAGQTSINSMELGGFSLNSNLMSAIFSPSSTGTGTGTTPAATLVFTNTSTNQDSNPDYVDQLNLVIPSAMGDPTSITVPSGWVATKTSALHWQIALCAAPTNATPCSSSETSAIAPGGQLTITLNYSSPGPPAGTYAVTWYATGANGGEDTHLVSTTASITFTTTAASIDFSKVNGTAVTSGVEPQVGTDATTSGSTFTYVITNTGSVNITSSTITVPHLTRAGLTGSDATGKLWTLSSASVALSAGSSGTSGTCSGSLNAAQLVNPTSSADGHIALSGCALLPGGTATLTIVMQAPYQLSVDYLFSATVTGSSTQSAQPTYSSSDAMLIVEDGYLTILTPGNGSVGGANVLTASTGSGATPSTTCTSCSVTVGTPTLIDLGTITATGTFTTTDLVDASVRSDANSPNSWNVSLSVDTATSGGDTLSAQVDSAHSSSFTGLAYTPAATSWFSIPVIASPSGSNPGQSLATYTGTGNHNPSDTIMNFKVTVGGTATPQTHTLTFTLVFN